MKTKFYISIGFIMIIVAVIGFSGCAKPGRVTGGGWMPSKACLDQNCEDSEKCGKANFGFNASNCYDCASACPSACASISGHFNYHDINAPGFDGGVKMNGIVIGANECVDRDSSLPTLECAFCRTYYDDSLDLKRVYSVKISYRSTNPKFKGEGEALACVADNGEGVNAVSADLAIIKVLSGPYTDYWNMGPVQGNIQAHDCED